MGFKEGDAEKLLLAAFKQFPLRRMPPSKTMGSAGSNSVSVKAKASQDVKDLKVSGSKGPTEKVNEEPVSASSLALEKSNEEGENDNPSHAEKTNEGNEKIKKSEKDDVVRFTEEGDQIPVGNGGSTEQYKWTQTLNEITIAMPLPPSTRAKDLDVQIKTTSLKINHKNSKSENPLLDGEILDRIRTDESTWSIESDVMLVTLEKIEKRWWNRVFVDAKETIDVNLVDKTHKLSDYDESIQGMVRKILFDQRQDRLGLPSSDEILAEKDEELEKNDGNGDVENKREKLDFNNLPPGVEFIDKHNFPGGKR